MAASLCPNAPFSSTSTTTSAFFCKPSHKITTIFNFKPPPIPPPNTSSIFTFHKSPFVIQCSIANSSAPHNPPPLPRPHYIPNRISDPNYVRIFDTTLRDGEQSPGATMTTKQKLDIARQLSKLGVDIIEAGFPASSEADLEAVQLIAKQIGNFTSGAGDDQGHVPVICGLARCNKRDIDKAWEAVKYAWKPRIHTFIATSEIHMEHKLKKTKQQVLETARDMVAYARSLGCEDVEFSPEDAGRSDRDFLYEILGEVIKAGATTLNIPDTVGFRLPHEFGQLIADIKANTPGIENVIISTHCQNDLGLATANTLAGASAGARQVEVTINGIGERAGNASLEEVVMTLKCRGEQALGGLYTGINAKHIVMASKMVEEYSGLHVQPHKAIVGANAFAHESGIHQDGMLKHKNTYEIISPEDIGLQRFNESGIVLGKLSGRHALKAKLLELGYDIDNKGLEDLFWRFKSVAEKKKNITDDDLIALVSDEVFQPQVFWKLGDVQVTCGTLGLSTATVKLMDSVLPLSLSLQSSKYLICAMAVPPNRSPSPLSSRPIPHSRNLDCNSGPRRSFSGNPFHRPSVLTNPRSLNPVTPANSPAGFGRRNSLGREGTGNLQVCEEKENEKDQNLKPVKQRSPANGSKNFMSPTISAASKFTPPGKKILAERNDPVRTSISLSDGIATFCSAISSEMTEDPKSEKVLDQQKAGGNMESTVLECPRISKPLKRVTFSEVPSNSENGTESKPEKITVDSDFVGVDSNSKNTHSPFPMSPIIAPVDADPSLPPYDPKTNFRSPRPQFLHYKPNPRIEVLLKKEKGHDLGEAKRLEDSFMLEGSSETFSDTDGTEASYSEDSQKDSDDSSLAENVLPEGMEEEPIHSSCPISHDLSEGILEEKDEGNAILAQGVVEDKGEEKANIAHINHDMAEGIAYDIGETKPRFFTKLKCVSLLLVLLVAGISIWATNSPFMDSSVLNILKSSKLREPSEIAVLAKANIDGLGQRFKQLSFDSVSHLFLLINNLGGRAHLAPVQFMNLTDLQNDALGCGYLEDHHQSQKFAQNLEDDDFEEEEDAETEPLEEQTFAEAASEDRNKKEPEEESDLGTENEDFEEEEDAETEPLEASDLGTEELPLEAAQLADTNAPESSESPWNQEEASHIDPELRCKVDSEDDLTPEVQSEAIAYELHPKVIETKNLEGDMGLDSRIKVESLSADIDTKGTSDASSSTLEDRSSEKIESLVVGSENRYSAYAIMGIASLFLVLMLSALAFISLKPGHSDIQTVALDTRELSSKKMNLLSSVPDKIFQDGPSCHNWATEVEVEGESCPSEMSSFQKSSSYSRKNLKVANEAHSQERKPRKYSKRESLASSSEFSMGSPSSYGSFTTYERISSKHANGDDEITTSVRRSSRIRNLVTSP